MTDPDQPNPHRESGAGAELLRSARSYRVSDETRKRAFAVAGIGVGLATAATGKAVAEGTLAGAKLWWLIGGVSGAAVLSAAYVLFAPPSEPATGAPHGANSAAPVAAPIALPEPAAPEPPPEAAASSEPEPARPAPSVPRTPAVPDLQAEVAALDAARRALAGGNAARALTLINAYQQKFPRGSLGIEASVLRIDALQRAGRTGEARQRASAFVKRFPKSPHAERMRRIAAQ